MESADDVELGDGLGISGSGGFKSFFERHGVGAGHVLFAAEGAQAAGGDTDIGGIDVAIDVEVGAVAVEALADVVGHPSDGENVAGAVERERVFGGEAFAGKHFGVNRLETRVVGLKRVGLEWVYVRHCKHDSAAGSRKSLGRWRSRIAGERRDEDRRERKRKQESQRTRSEGAPRARRHGSRFANAWVADRSRDAMA